ncbi:hypothetical protein ACHAQA_005507 [Verticillium albo-atrum]
MTENPQPLPTQIAIPSQALVAPSVPVSQPAPARKVETVEEEPYTIKCICNFSDDDGNTIYCETCDTWQHIECFYPDSREEALREDFSHSCADCKPRPLDRQKAIERTRRLKNGAVQEEAQDKKPRRPPSKSHKKKPKPTDLQLNGHPVGQENGKHGSPGDHPHPAKKVKASHRPSNSISSQANKRSPSDGSIRLNGQPPSPATSPPDLPTDFEIHGYSDRFITLYRNEPEMDPQKTPSNSFSSLATSNTMSLWLREPERMRQETGESYNDVFQKMPTDISKRQQELIVQDKQIPLTPETVLRWKYLTTPAAIGKDVPLIELCGQILFQKDYCADPTNLWEELSSPLPFVFFHPMLPLCIDTRNEMSQARYVRRSCKPNAVLDTYLSNTEYHFWLVSDRFVAANEQITLPWDFRLPKAQKARMMHLIGLGDDEVTVRDEPDMDEAEYQQTSGWLHRVLSESGGCACDLGSNCAFARFHRHYQARSHSRSQPPKKKPRKPKVHTISPTSTGHASNSRAASESHNEDADQDGRSTSERSKPPSRDRTPLRQGSLDQPGILTEPTEREKRKVQMVEDSFRRMEQQPPARKKKRLSDGASSKSSKSKTTSASTSGPNGTTRYVDAGTSRSKSGSPASAHSTGWQNPFKGPASRTDSVASHSRPASTAPRPKYCDASVQTDPVAGEWYSEADPTPKPRRRIISLSQRLLNNRHRARCDGVDQFKRRTSLPAPPTPTAMEIDPPALPRKSSESPSLQKEPEPEPEPVSPALDAKKLEDVAMTDAPGPEATSVSPTTTKAVLPSDEQVNGVSSPTEVKSPELRVQLPPVPAFGDATSAVANVTTPQTTTESVLPVPSSANAPPNALAPPAVNGIAHPSPVKKKLSLSDYTKSRLNKAAAKPEGGPKTPTTKDTKHGLDSIADAADMNKTNEAMETTQVNGVSPTLTTTDIPL